ncbi:calcineurin-like phosphoesterase family protein [Draconibacterium orientale]|uniref:calcineurin-like phosphoesterase family protein n=1 Tax=Draconibacterium orientale TaxID=1168034 RepID=UPI002ABDA040|nr:calcineurin-like phosphoesterase family protein [Draconibacterium orientale]
MMKIVKKIKLCLFFIMISLCLVQCSSGGDDLVTPEEESEEEGVGITPFPGMDLYGLVADVDGNPIKGVVVSDGYTCVITDEDGVYQMKKNEDAEFVYYSTPASCKVETESSQNTVAKFYKSLGANSRYDFFLQKLDAPESDFTVVGIGDPQPSSTANLNRFRNETVADLKNYFDGWSEPVYSLVLGDIVSDKPVLLGQMKALLGTIGMPSFVAIGNHDKVAESNTSLPRNSDEFESVFGPVNYSFNRGDVHFVCLDNVVFSSSSKYSGGFSDEQIDWLKEDLSYVSKDKMLIVYYHIPVRGTSGIQNRSAFLEALEGYAEVHLFSGHTHYNENYKHSSPLSAYEHVHAAACGAWWKSTINGDGTPNGYAVYRVSGASLKNWYYKPTGESAEIQIRLHAGDRYYGGEYAHYSYEKGENTVVANVWNADEDWKIEAFEDGVKVADLVALSKSTRDAWALGYHIGVLNRNPDNYSPACKHLFLHTMQNPEAQLEIRATDPFGNVYSQNVLVSDFSSAVAE